MATQPTFHCLDCVTEFADLHQVRKHSCPTPSITSSVMINIYFTCCGQTFKFKQDLAYHVNKRRFFDRPVRFHLLVQIPEASLGAGPPPSHGAVQRTMPSASTSASAIVSPPLTVLPLKTIRSESQLSDSELLDSQFSQTQPPIPVGTSTPLPPTLTLPDPDHISPTPSSDNWIDSDLAQILRSTNETMHPLTQHTPPSPSPSFPAARSTAETTSHPAVSSTSTPTCPSSHNTSRHTRPRSRSPPQPSLVFTLYNELTEMRQRAEAANSLIRSLAILALFLSHTLRHQTNLQLTHSHSEFIFLLQSSSIWPPRTALPTLISPQSYRY